MERIKRIFKQLALNKQKLELELSIELTLSSESVESNNRVISILGQIAQIDSQITTLNKYIDEIGRPNGDESPR